MESREELSKGDNREKFIAYAFCVMAALLFAALWIFAMCFSWNNRELENEYVYRQNDNIFINIVCLIAGLAIARFAAKIAHKHISHRKMDILAVVVGIICVITSMYWIAISKTTMGADQKEIVQYAVQLMNGDTSSLLKGGYLGMHRHQLGIVTFMRVFFSVFGEGNYKAFQYMSACMVFVIVYAGYKIIDAISGKNSEAAAVYLLFMLFCVPMYGYTPFVYGEIISTAFAMLGTWVFLSTLEKFRCRKLVLLALDCGFMLLLRRNTVIIAIAFLVVIIVKAINRPEWKIILTGVAVIAGLIISQTLVNAIYSSYIPKDSEEMPAILYVAMGTRDTAGDEPGWYDCYNLLVFRENEYNAEASSAAAVETIKNFLGTCKASPMYAIRFYALKINTQWNVPMYQCLAMNNAFYEEPEGLAWEIYFNGKDVYLENFMNIYQLLIYGGVVLLLIYMRKKWVKIENYVLLIGVYGGFLFSLIWEAKPRYVFPYFIMMIPYAAIGLTELRLSGLSCRK
jgi:uncharacterized membrane protein